MADQRMESRLKHTSNQINSPFSVISLFGKQPAHTSLNLRLLHEMSTTRESEGNVDNEWPNKMEFDKHMFRWKLHAISGKITAPPHPKHQNRKKNKIYIFVYNRMI